VSHTPRNAPDEPYIVFADQRRLRWWWQLALRRTAYVLIGAVTLGAGAYIVHRVRPDAFTGVGEFEQLIGISPEDTVVSVTQVTRTQPVTQPVTLTSSAPRRTAVQQPSLPPQTTALSAKRPATKPEQAPPSAAAPPTNVRPAPQQPAMPSAAPGWLVVSSRPWGNLYVDGRLVGNTPQATVWLTPGAHRVEIKRDGFKSFLADVTIDANREFRLTRVTLDPTTQ
jgi:hypothetical protein